jgi:hypothetical protein
LESDLGTFVFSEHLSLVNNKTEVQTLNYGYIPFTTYKSMVRTVQSVVSSFVELVFTSYDSSQCDPDIIWNDEPLVVFMANPDSYGYAWMEWGSGDRWATYATWFGPVFTNYAYEETLASNVTGLAQYYLRADLVETISGDSSHFTSLNQNAPYGQWLDYYGEAFEEYEELSFYNPGQDEVVDVVVVDITVAPDDGFGTPIEECGKTKRVAYICYDGNSDWTIFDEISLATGVDMDGNVADDTSPVGETWEQVSGVMRGYFGHSRVEVVPALYVYESSVSNATGVVQFEPHGDTSVIGRYVDSLNYWEARIRTNDGSDPTLELNKIVGGVISNVDYLELTGYGDMRGDRVDLRLTFWGNIIEAELDEAWITTEPGWPHDAGPLKVVANDSTHNTATKWGFYSDGINAELQRFGVYVKDAELRNTFMTGSYPNIPNHFGDKLIAPVQSSGER